MRKGFNCLLVSIATMGLAGCVANTRMPLHESTEKVDDAGGPLLLMTATIRNVYHPSFQPKLLLVHVEKTTAKPRDNSREGKTNFAADDLSGQLTANSGPGDYLIRMRLPEGDYRICGMTSRIKTPVAIGTFFAPLLITHSVQGSGVFYLGHVHAIVRERQGDEFRAGSPMPYIDQLTAGAFGGTFDITISDRFETDEKAFRERFPQLAGVEIKKTILAPFNRPAVQKWWQNYDARKVCVLAMPLLK